MHDDVTRLSLSCCGLRQTAVCDSSRTLCDIIGDSCCWPQWTKILLTPIPVRQIVKITDGKEEDECLSGKHVTAECSWSCGLTGGAMLPGLEISSGSSNSWETRVAVQHKRQCLLGESLFLPFIDI